MQSVKQTYPDDYEEVLKLYPHRSDKETELSATALSSDRFIAYSTWKWFDLHRKNSTQPVYRYLYSKLMPPLVNQNLTTGLAGGTEKKDPDAVKMPGSIGAPHACEIEYCMGNLHLINDFAWTPQDYAVSETMQNFFANFIISGNPNSSKVPNWPAAKANDGNPDVMVIDVESKSVKAAYDARYLFLDKAYKNQK
jgi:para-nitrobenzyl esterase